MSRQGLRRALGGLLFLIMAAGAVYGGDFFGVREQLSPPATRVEGSAFQPVDQNAPARAESVRRSQPYWRPLTRFSGSGPLSTAAFAVDPGALQWRVKWACERGALAIQPQQPSGQDEGRRLVDTAGCPQKGSALSVAPGTFKLDVQAQGPWTAQIEEQVDVPLVEPPTAKMTAQASQMVARGTFYDIDEEGEGTVKLYRAKDGSVSLRLDDFYVSPNVDLEIRFSELERPTSTQQVAAAPFEDIVFLKATTGAMNYRIPPGVLSDRVRSVVIWCEITSNAYAAASLRG